MEVEALQAFHKAIKFDIFIGERITFYRVFTPKYLLQALWEPLHREKEEEVEVFENNLLAEYTEYSNSSILLG